MHFIKLKVRFLALISYWSIGLSVDLPNTANETYGHRWDSVWPL